MAASERNDQGRPPVRGPSLLFDPVYYLQSNPDVARTDQDPLIHFLLHGAKEGRKPHPLFDPIYYLKANPQVAASGVNPLVHFMEIGAAQKLKPHPLFDTAYYVEHNPDVTASGKNPLIHFLETGAKEGRKPNPLFDPQYYLNNNPDVADRDINPLVHFIEFGAAEGRKPSAGFDCQFYLKQNPDVAASGENPLVHFLEVGQRQRREAIYVEAVEFRDLAQSTGDFGADYRAAKQRLSEARNPNRKTFRPNEPPQVTLDAAALRTVAKQLRFDQQPSPQVSIIIPVYGQLQLTLECLTSLKRDAGEATYEVIIIDDGSTDQTAEVLSGIAGISYVKNETNLGFLLSCNRAAERARGQFLLFLNNDTQVTSGWLDTLVRTFDEHERVGVAAPKLLFPNGMLQEAGALVHRDCSSQLIGVFDDPDLPRYNYPREVEYASGACLLLKTEVFRSLGGFDTRFAPAYCEDSDICFQMRQAGLRVMYNPASAVIHHLSITSNAVHPEYKIQRVTTNQQKFSEKWQQQVDELQDVRLIAFYLPQFHPIAENDRWWGKGFTEWVNVAKARPNFVGHYQPHLPSDLGFYDLRVPEIMEQQAELARKYGIFGFCYFYYWFDGKRLLEMPLERMLKTGRPQLPFCLSWANENWTRRWDGKERDVLIAQNHSVEGDKRVIADLIRYMDQPNYIRINGKPLLLIYRINLFPDIRRTVEIWRQHCRREGLGEIYLGYVESFEHATSFENPKAYGFDASVEYPPHGMAARVTREKILNRNFSGVVNDYQEVAARYVSRPIPGYTRFRGVMPSWDNTARRQDNGTVFDHSTPGIYQAWLETALEDTRKQNFGDERIVFLNAWNEWAEGAHLEPDRRFGHGYLEATRNAKDAWMLR